MSKTAPKHGVSIILVIAFFAVATTLIGAWVRGALLQQRQSRRWHDRSQAVWLAEAGVRRAQNQLAADADYRGQRWEIPASQLGGKHPAIVTIAVDAVDDTRMITATCDYPAGARRQVRITKSRRLDSPNNSGASP